MSSRPTHPVNRRTARGPVPLLVATLGVVALSLGTVACSDDSSSGASKAADRAAKTGLDKTSGRPFDATLDTVGQALTTATSADRYEVDGKTVHLHFSKGSQDSVSATINCSAARAISAAGDAVVLHYPDGTVDCADTDPEA